MEPQKIQRFLTAHKESYPRALAEVMSGCKTTHWMWYVFPQIEGLGCSEMAKYYALSSLQEAIQFIHHPILGRNLKEIANAVLSIENKSANEIFSSPDDMKLHSCMTLFALIPEVDGVFRAVIDKYFSGQEDMLTLKALD